MEVDGASTAEDKDDKTIEAAVPTESPKKAEESSAVVPKEKIATPTKAEAGSGDAAVVLPVATEKSIEENKAEEVKATVDETKTATAECK